MVWSYRKLKREPKPCGVYKEQSRRLQDIAEPQSSQNQRYEKGEPSCETQCGEVPDGRQAKGRDQASSSRAFKWL